MGNDNIKKSNTSKHKEDKKIKIRYTVSFNRKKTKTDYRKPKYARISTSPRSKLDEFSLIKHRLTTDSCGKKIEQHNTLVFIVNNNATKAQIKHALLKLYNLQTVKINTLLQADGRKKAYVKLPPNKHALEIVKKIVFRQLSEPEVKKIANIMLKSVIKRAFEKEIKLNITENFKDRVVNEGFDPIYGARPLRRAIIRLVEDLLAEKILSGNVKEGDSVILDVDEDGKIKVVNSDLQQLTA